MMGYELTQRDGPLTISLNVSQEAVGIFSKCPLIFKEVLSYLWTSHKTRERCRENNGYYAKSFKSKWLPQGISLAQALSRAGGLDDKRTNAKGVFIFRFEESNALDWPLKPVVSTPDGKVPVVYRADLLDPATFFAAQSFPIKDKDLLYVSNAPAVELQKFLNLIVSMAYPTLNMMNSLTP